MQPPKNSIDKNLGTDIPLSTSMGSSSANPVTTEMIARIPSATSASERTEELKGRIAEEEKKWPIIFDEFFSFGIDHAKNDKEATFLTKQFFNFFGNYITKTGTDLSSHIFQQLSKKDMQNGVQYGDDAYLGTKFIANLLTLVNKHLANVSPNDDEEKISAAFEGLMTEILDIAFPNKSEDKNLPHLLQKLLSGGGISGVPNFIANSVFPEKVGCNIQDFSWDHLISLMAKYPKKLYMSSYKEITNVDKNDLCKFNGLENLSKDISKIALNKVRGLQKIPFDLKSLILTNKEEALSVESQSLLNTVFVKFLGGRVNAAPSLNSNDESGPKDIVEQSWSWLDNTLQSAISKILMTVFKPQGNESVDDKLAGFVDTLSTKAMTEIPQWNAKIQIIEKLDHKHLATHLTTKAKTIKFFTEDLSQMLSSKKMKEADWDIKAKELALKVAYYEFAEDLLKHELNADRFTDILPNLDMLPNDYIISLLYDQAGGFLREFYEHHQNITKQAEACDVTLASWDIGTSNVVEEVNTLIDTQLAKLITTLDDKASNNTLLKNYGFLNKIVIHLLRANAAKGKNSTHEVKEETLNFSRNAIKIIIVKEIGEKIKEKGVSPKVALKLIAEQLIADAKLAVASVKPVDGEKVTLITNVGDREKFEAVLQKTFDAYHELKKSREEVKLFELKQKVGSDWKLSVLSKKELLTIFSFSDEFPESQNDRRIFEKVMEDALDAFKNTKPTDDFNDVKEKLFISWKLKEKTKSLFSKVLPKKDADLLLSKTLQNKGIWDLVSDGLLAPYMQVFYHNMTMKTFEELKAPSLKPLIDRFLPQLKKMLGNFKTENNVADGILGGLLGEDGTFVKLFDDAVHPFIMSIIAYHVNETDDLTSEERTATLFWNILKSVYDSHREIDALINPTPEQITAIIKKISINLIDLIIPVELWMKYVPDESQFPHKRADFTDLIEKLLIGAHAHVTHLDTLTKIGGESLEKKGGHLGVRSFLRSQVANRLKPDVGSPKTSPTASPEPLDQSKVTDNSWLADVKNRIFGLNDQDPNNPLTWFIEAFAYGIADFLLVSKTTKGDETKPDILGNLEEKFGRVAETARNIFNSLEDDHVFGESINITTQEKKTFFKEILSEPFDVMTADAKIQANREDFAMWLVTHRSINVIFTDEEWDTIIFPKVTAENEDFLSLMKRFLTKDLATGFIAPIIKDIYNLRFRLQDNAEAIKENIQHRDPTLASFIKVSLVDNLSDVISKLGTDPEDFKDLPPFIKSVLTKLLTTPNKNIASLRNRLIDQAIHIIMGQLTDPMNPKSATIIRDKIAALINVYVTSSDPEIAKANDLAIANELFGIIPPDQWDKYFTGFVGSVVSRELVIKAIVPFISQIRTSIQVLEKEESIAKEFIKSIDTKKDIDPMIKAGIKSMEALIDDIGSGKQKIAEKQPDLIKNLLKEECSSEVATPVIKKAISSLMYVALHHLLKSDKPTTADQKVELSQEKIMLVFEKIMDILKPGNTTNESAVELIKLLVPKEMLKTHLPAFLQKSITHEKIVEWFLTDYVDEIAKINLEAANYTLGEEDEHIGRLQKWVKSMMVAQFNDPTIFGEKGAILHGAQNKMLNADKTDLTFAKYVDRIVDQVVKLPETKKFLNTNFLAYTLNESLKDIDNISLPAGDFVKQTAEKLVSLIVPPVGPAVDRLEKISGIPTPARGKAFELAKEGVETLVTNLTERNKRVIFLTGSFAPPASKSPTRAKKLKRLEELSKKDNDTEFLKESKKLFQSNLVFFAKNQVEKYVDEKKWSKPIKAIAKFFLKIAVAVVMHLSIKHRAWNFISNKVNDDIIKKIIWNFANTASSYSDERVDSRDLAKTMKGTLTRFKLLPFDFARGKVGTVLGGYLGGATDKDGKETIPGKTFIDVLAGPAVPKPPKTAEKAPAVAVTPPATTVTPATEPPMVR